MNQNEMIQSLRAEIAKLQRVLDLLLEQPNTPEEGRRPGRLKGSSNRATSFNPEEFAPQRRTMSAEGKSRIAAAQKKRWAPQKGTAGRNATAKKAASEGPTSKASSRKLAGKAAPVMAKKSVVAGKRTATDQTLAKTSAKNASKKTAGKRTIRAASKRPAKQAAGTGPQLQTTA